MESSSPNAWDFEFRGGMTFRDGKPYWPDCIHLFLDRKESFRVIQALAIQLEDEKRVNIDMTFCGELTEVTE